VQFDLAGPTHKVTKMTLNGPRLFLPAELADEGVEGRREKELEAGHANHTE
jgi:hypothetical protein